MKPAFDLSLYLVTDPQLGGERDLVSIVNKAVAGGVTLVQLRDPNASTRELVASAVKLKEQLEPAGVPLIVNDRVDVALASGASGVHLGASDMSASDARKILGDDALIGLSIGSLDELEAEKTALESTDYVGVGPVFSTTTKSDAGAAIGTKGLAKLVRRLDVPTVAIGGISAQTAVDCIRAGANGVAVVSAIISADDPHAAARELKKSVTEEQSR